MLTWTPTCRTSARILLILSIGATLLAATTAARAQTPEVRTWKSEKGFFQITGKLVVAPEGEATIQTASGRWVTVSLKTLTEADRNYVAKMRSALRVEVPPNGATAPAAAPKVNHLVDRPYQPFPKPVRTPQPASTPEPAATPDAFNAEAFVARFNAEQPEPVFKRDLVLGGHRNLVIRLAVSSNGKFAIAFDKNRQCITWDLTTGKQVGSKTFPPANAISALAISNDGKYALTGENGSVRVFDASTFKQLFEHGAPTSEIDALHVTPDMKWMSAVDRERNFYHFPLLGGAGTATRWNGKKVNFKSPAIAAISPDGKSAIGIRAREGLAHRVVTKNGRLAIESKNVFKAERDANAVAVTNAGEGVDIDHIYDCDGRFDSRFQLEPGWSFKIPSQIATAAHLAIYQRDDTSFVIKTGDNSVEFIHPASHQVYLFRQPVQPAPVAILPGATGTSIFAIRLGAIERWTVVPFERWNHIRFYDTVASLHGDYQKLEEIAAVCAAAEKPFPWSQQSQIDDFISALYASYAKTPGSAAYVEELKKWVTTRPKTVAGRVLLAMYLIEEAWALRGDKVAALVGREAFHRFSAKVETARGTLAPVMETKKPPVLAYENWIRIAKAQGWEPKKYLEVADRAFADYPDDGRYLHEMFQVLLPRWGGFEKAAGRYIIALTEKRGGVTGHKMHVSVATVGLRFFQDDEFFEKTGLNYDKLMESLDAISKEDPEFAANYGLYFALAYKDEENLKKYGKMIVDTVDGAKWEPWEGKESHFKYALTKAGVKGVRRGPPALIPVN